MDAYREKVTIRNPLLSRANSLFLYLPLIKWSSHLVRLCGLMEHAGVDGCSHQVVGGSDGVNVTGEMEVKLK